MFAIETIRIPENGDPHFWAPRTLQIELSPARDAHFHKIDCFVSDAIFHAIWVQNSCENVNKNAFEAKDE